MNYRSAQLTPLILAMSEEMYNCQAGWLPRIRDILIISEQAMKSEAEDNNDSINLLKPVLQKPPVPNKTQGDKAPLA